MSYFPLLLLVMMSVASFQPDMRQTSIGLGFWPPAPSLNCIRSTVTSVWQCPPVKPYALTDELVSEVLEANEIILATPMYNFAVPAALKAWIDHVVRAGKDLPLHGCRHTRGPVCPKTPQVGRGYCQWR